MGFFLFCEDCHLNFDENCIESVDRFWQYIHFHNVISTEYGSCFHLLVSFLGVYSFPYKGLPTYLVVFIPRYLIVLGYYEWDCYPHLLLSLFVIDVQKSY
jgi:hypothetical protein